MAVGGPVLEKCAIVASQGAAGSAQALRDALQREGRVDIALFQSLPRSADTVVLLLWDADLEQNSRTAKGLDVRALIDLWSEGRLIVARRDSAPLPLGLRDLPALPPESTVEDIRRAVETATLAKALANARAKRDAEFESELKREAEFREREPEPPAAPAAARASSPVPLSAAPKSSRAFAIGVGAVVLVLIVAGYYMLNMLTMYAPAPPEKGAGVQEHLDAVRKMSAELDHANNRVQEARIALDNAGRAEAEAEGRAAEASKSREAAQLAFEMSRRAEEDARKSGDIVRQRHFAQLAAKRAAEAQAATDSVARERAAAQRLATERPRLDAVLAQRTEARQALQARYTQPLAQRAQALERLGRGGEAVDAYVQAARAGSGKAAKRLGEVYESGIAGVPRNQAESRRWYNAARELGEDVTVGVGFRTYSVALVALILLAATIASFLWWSRSRGERKAVAGPPKAEVEPTAATVMFFISYSHRDLPRVEPIVLQIEALGRRVWMDREEVTGHPGWAAQIVRAIRNARAVVLMASPNSYSSDQVVRELYLAMNNKKTIVPIELEPADLPDELEYILAPFQRHKLTGKDVREVLSRALAVV